MSLAAPGVVVVGVTAAKVVWDEGAICASATVWLVNALEALPLADQHADAYVRSECYRHIGFHCFAEEHDVDAALEHLWTSLRLREEWGDARSTASGMLSIGQAELMAGRHAEAAAHLREALEQLERAGVGGRRAAAAREWLSRAEAGEPAPE